MKDRRICPVKGGMERDLERGGNEEWKFVEEKMKGRD